MADSNFVSSGYYLVKGEAKRLHDGRVYVVTDNGYAEDMQEVVRCEDCRHNSREPWLHFNDLVTDCNCFAFTDYEGTPTVVKPDGFCYFGEPKVVD